MSFSQETLDRIVNECGLELPLDGDDVDDVIEELRDALNIHQGNDSDDEYEEESSL